MNVPVSPRVETTKVCVIVDLPKNDKEATTMGSMESWTTENPHWRALYIMSCSERRVKLSATGSHGQQLL